MSDYDEDMNAGWRDSVDYQPRKYDTCRMCDHPYFRHCGETYDGSNTMCTYVDDEGACACSEFEP